MSQGREWQDINHLCDQIDKLKQENLALKDEVYKYAEISKILGPENALLKDLVRYALTHFSFSSDHHADWITKANQLLEGDKGEK